MPSTRPHPAYFVAVGIFLTVLALGAAMAFDGEDASSEPQPIDDRLLATAVPPTETPEPTPEPSPEPTPEPTSIPVPTPLPDRTVCAQIAGTPYRSATERAYFLANC